MFDFFQLRPPAFGLDISDVSLKIAYLEQQAKGFRLASFGETAIPKGVIEAGEIQNEGELASTITRALKNVKGKRIRTTYVAAALPEQQAFIQVVQLPRMEKQELTNAIRLQAENYIPYPPETVYLDYAVVPPFHNHADHLDILLAALSRQVVDAYVSVLQKVGLVPAVLEIEAMSLARAIVKKGVTPVPLLLLDIGGARTKVSIFSGYGLRFTTSISVCSQQFTQAIAKALHVDEEKAEEFKRLYGLQKNPDDALAKEVFEALIPAATDFVEQIKKYMEYYKSHPPHHHLAKQQASLRKIVLSGGGANLKGFPEFLMRQLKAEVVIANPWVNIISPRSRELPDLPFQESLRYGTALGLALRGARREE